MPRRGYVSITLRRETWEKLQKLKMYLGALTYDELIDKIYTALMRNIENIQVQSPSESLEKIYELEKLIDNISMELELVKSQLSKISAKVEVLEKKSRTR
ncbi:MAG: hypothetical protein GXO23_02620 [Crenarchaeota archaeon]|nr:hypothetical protein [Thermoproteota archaeon]